MGRVELRDPWWGFLFSWWLAIELQCLEMVGVPAGESELRQAAQHYERTVAPHRRLRFTR